VFKFKLQLCYNEQSIKRVRGLFPLRNGRKGWKGSKKGMLPFLPLLPILPFPALSLTKKVYNVF